MENESIFETANRICQKEINIFIDPREVSRTKGLGGRAKKIKKISLGQRMKALKKWMNVLHREYVKRHEIPCAIKPCIDCCHVVPIIQSRTEFEYLKKALSMSLAAQHAGDIAIRSMFKEWFRFCQSTGINPHSPFLRHADMLEWMEYKIPCPFYSTSFGKCMIDNDKPINCRFGRNLMCPPLASQKPVYLTPWEMVSMDLDSTIAAALAYSDINLYVEVFEWDSGNTWVDSVNNVMVKADTAMFPDKPKFERRPIYTLFKFAP